MANAWDMRPDETSLNYAAFRLYLQLGVNRTLRQTSQMLPCNIQLAGRWSVKYDWINRIKAWEQFLMDTFVAQTTGIMRENGDQIISDMLVDYNDLLTMLRIKQNDLMDKIAANPDDVSFDDLTKLANARKTIDDLGRRASNLPNVATKAPEKAVTPVRKIIGWANPPKLPSGGEEDV